MDLILRIFLVLCIFHTCHGERKIDWEGGETSYFDWNDYELGKHFIDKDEFEGIRLVFRRERELIEGERAAAIILLAANQHGVELENRPEVTTRTERKGKKRVTVPTGIKFKTGLIGARTIYPTIKIRNKNGLLRDVKLGDFRSGNTIFSDLNLKNTIKGSELFTKTPNDPWRQNGVSVTQVYYVPNTGPYKPAFQISWNGRGEEDVVDAAINGHIDVEYKDFPFIFSGGIGDKFEIGHYKAHIVPRELIQITTKQRWDICKNHPRNRPAC